MIQEAGSTSWRIEIDEPQRLVIGLFVRDVAGLTSRHAWLPHAAPATPRANEDGPEDAARQWDLWWDQALRADWDMHGQSQAQISASWWIPPNFESLQSAPELQGVVARHFSEAVAWSNDRKREHVELMIGIRTPGGSIGGADGVMAQLRRTSSRIWNETWAGGPSISGCGSLRSLSQGRSSGRSTLTMSS